MTLTAAELAREYPGEGPHVELKRGVSRERIIDAAVAFSNTDGGLVIIGVEDNGGLRGVDRPGEAEREIDEALRNVHNPGTYQVHRVTVEDRVVLVLSVARRREGFAQTPSGVVRVRRGASNVPLVGEEMSRFVRQRAFQHEEDTTTQITVAAAAPAQLEQLRGAFGWPDTDLAQRLEAEGLVVVERGSRRLTVAGALLLLDRPADIGARAEVEVLRFPVGAQEPDKRMVFDGPVPAQVLGATEAVMDELGTVSALIGPRRVDLPRLPELVVREAIANAIAHRSYAVAGSRVVIEIRPEAVIVTSPGGLPEPITPANIRDHQAARNRKVLEALRRFGLAEDLGLGVDRIQDAMDAHLLEPPTFHDDGASVRVQLPLRGVVSPQERAWVSSLQAAQKLDRNDRLILVAALRDAPLANVDVRSLLHIDSTAARGRLQRLRDLGLLVQEGQRAGAQYRPAPNLGLPAAAGHPADHRRLVLAAASDGPLTNSDVRRITGLERTEALALLKELVDEGRLVRTGARRGTKYHLADGSER